MKRTKTGLPVNFKRSVVGQFKAHVLHYIESAKEVGAETESNEKRQSTGGSIKNQTDMFSWHRILSQKVRKSIRISSSAST